MKLQIEDAYTGVGQVDIHVGHETKNPTAKQGLTTTIYIKADESCYMTTLAGAIGNGGWVKFRLEGCEALGAIETLRDVLNLFLAAVKQDID